MELKKLQGQIEEGKAAFDDTLNNLFQQKIRSEMMIYDVRYILLIVLSTRRRSKSSTGHNIQFL